jgi:organic radical activating enzyme
VSDLRGEALVNGVLGLVRKHQPIHVSLVGGEPMVRHRELSRILPALGQMGVHTLLVTNAVIRMPEDWITIPRLRIAVSVDGLPEHHDIRRKPATYERIVPNIQGCTVNIHWTITRPMLDRAAYLEEYLDVWSDRSEVNRIWASIYSPQVGEHTPEMLTRDDRTVLVSHLGRLRKRFPRFLFSEFSGSAHLCARCGAPPNAGSTSGSAIIRHFRRQALAGDDVGGHLRRRSYRQFPLVEVNDSFKRTLDHQILTASDFAFHMQGCAESRGHAAHHRSPWA